MRKLEIKEGQKFGMLTVIKEGDKVYLPCGQSNRTVMCTCDCGEVKTVKLLHLSRGRTTSCGCVQGERSGDSKDRHPLYIVWRGMKNRCYCDSYKEKHLYKDKGIVICDAWKYSYLTFKEWAINNGWAEGLVIDRECGDGNYEPNNCRWVTPLVNGNNTSQNVKVMYKGNEVGLSMLLHELGKHNHLFRIRTRICKYGWDVERAINTPVRIGNYRRGKKAA